jgi:adenylosuccinate lyase
MIPRYSRPEMSALWTEEHKFDICTRIEAYACEAMEQAGTIPAGTAARVLDAARVDPSHVDALDDNLRHDFIAFLTALNESVGPQSRFIHFGMTTSDVLDTCLSVRLTESGRLLLAGLDALLVALKEQALEHKYTICPGRTHGMHAEPTTFGLKMAGFYAEFARARQRLAAAVDEVRVCAISGPVGTYSYVAPEVEAHVADRLGLRCETISTQVIPRDRHATFFVTLAVIASSVERLAVEVRGLQRTEVGEVEERFHSGQKGSSAMPHKRNPVLSENLTGLARLVRGYAMPALEDVALWHERDISHSSVERVIGPDACIALDFALDRATEVVRLLSVNPARMRANFERAGGLFASQGLMLSMIQAGSTREQAYAIVQRLAMQAWEDGGDFHELVLADPAAGELLSKEQVAEAFDERRSLQRVDAVFERVFGAAPAGQAGQDV